MYSISSRDSPVTQDGFCVTCGPDACKVCVIGNVVIETKLYADTIPDPEEQAVVRIAYSNVGGSAACVASQLSRFGMKVSLVSQIGLDDEGDSIIGTLQDVGIGTHSMVRRGNSPRFYSLFDGSGSRRLLIKNEPWDCGSAKRQIELAARDVDFAVLCPVHTELFLFALHLLRSKQVPVMILPQAAYFSEPRGFFTEIISMSWITVMNDYEFGRYFGSACTEDGLQSLSIVSGQMIAVTCAERGCIARMGNRILQSPGIPAELVDTSGAGDCFAAGLIWGMTCKFDMSTVLHVANLCGSAACEGVDVVETGIPTQKIMGEVLANHRENVH